MVGRNETIVAAEAAFTDAREAELEEGTSIESRRKQQARPPSCSGPGGFASSHHRADNRTYLQDVPAVRQLLLLTSPQFSRCETWPFDVTSGVNA
jgi:hypothetical protein